jgi:tRNA-specific 2-thiouridylase
MKEKTCLALYSGGLDSMLAVRVMQNQGINVIVLNFNTGFFFGAYDKKGDTYIYKAKTPYEITVVDISKEFFEMIKNPVHGFGRHMNPCIDCKIFMLRKAKELMPEYDAGFVITGEVLGQRPMTQNMKSLRTIEKESGMEGFLLRPLCAKNMPETEPERLGWVDRGKLLDLQGRGRTRQLELAVKWGMQEFVKTPAGGCILTEDVFSKRLKDFLISNSKIQISSEDMLLLRLGRHFKKDNVKFVVGRNKKENEALMNFKDKGMIFDTKDAPGPVTVALGAIDDAAKIFIAAVTAGYSDAKANTEANVEVISNGSSEVIKVKPVNSAEAKKFRIDL